MLDDRFSRDTTIGLFFLLATTGFFWFVPLDMIVQDYFHSQGKWYLSTHPFWQFIYTYGPYPAITVSFVGLISFAGSYLVQPLKPYRKIAAFLFLLLLVGSGILVNGIFKSYWGRARPREVSEFGGDFHYTEPFLLGQTGANSSFPSGHASTGFFFIFPYFLYLNRRPVLAYSGLALGIGLGCLMGMGRMVQGAHFASDILWSGGIMYLTGALLYYLLGLKDSLYLQQNSEQLTRKKKAS